MVEVERLGFTVLCSGESRDGTATIGPNVNIIFIHGLRGHPRRTWECATIPLSAEPSSANKPKRRSIFKLLKTSKSRGEKSPERHVPENSASAQTVYWPYDLIPAIIPNARILTYGYNSDVIGGIFSAQNKNSILQHGNDLMVKLERAVQNEKPIIFLAHSLGGIVLKNALHRCQESMDPKFSKVVDRVDTVMFFGTPHRGSDIASWGRIASNIANAALQDTNGSLLTDLQVDSQILDLIHDDFLKVLHKKNIKIHSFQEGRGLIGVKGFSGKVVEDFSSKIGYSLEVLETIDANHMEMIRFDGPKNAGFREVSAALAGYVKSVSEQVFAGETYEPYTYLNNFYIVNYAENLSRVSVRHPNTCTWLPANETFDRWLYGKGPTMCWLHGFPGRGKSVIAKYVIESLQQGNSDFLRKPLARNPFVAYFICYDQDEARKSPRNVLRSIIYQLLAEKPGFAQALNKKYPVITSFHTDSVEFLWDILGLVVSSMRSQPLIIVIDAFDELTKDLWISFLEGIMKFLVSHAAQVKIFVTSRTEPVIENYFSSFDISDIVIDDESNREDVAAYLSETVHRYAVENSFDTVMRDTILHEIQSRADGMFLWATLAWEHFKDGVGSWTKARVRQKLSELQRLPPGLDSLYHLLLLKVDQRLQDELFELLLWLITTLRPLSLSELSTCLTLNTRPHSSKDIDAKLSLKAFIKRTLPHLVKVNQQDVVALVHQSFKDFLLQVKHFQFQGSQATNTFFVDVSEANCRVAADCLAYLALDDIWMVSPEDTSFDSTTHNLKEIEKFVFAEYAMYHWARHLTQIDDSHEVWIQFKRVLRNPRT
ncbi:hypothetical protein DL98DRAFT_662333 [Cadophora sp. DSE1049]|nr:hypothetical protein DL98DRAFT_662333 [Cadophora sp. DSE1049]